MLKELNVSYSIIGHSERRAIGETDTVIAEKVKYAHENEIVPIVCVGEQSKTEPLSVLEGQVKVALSKTENKEVVFAYEPVWAIGTGEQPTNSKINKAIKIIKDAAKLSGFDVNVLYGGSVKLSNYKEIKSSKADGYLMGGVSLNLDEFLQIVKGE